MISTSNVEDGGGTMTSYDTSLVFQHTFYTTSNEHIEHCIILTTVQLDHQCIGGRVQHNAPNQFIYIYFMELFPKDFL